MENSGQTVKLQQSSTNPQILLALDENALIKRIQVTHGPENHEINVKPLLKMIEVIMDLAAGAPGEFRPSDLQVEALSEQNLGDMREHLALKINSISCDILGNLSGSQDAQEAILPIFSALSRFSWNAKGIIALAAFAANYGEFWLVAQLCPIDPIAKSLALLEKLPELDHDTLELRSTMIKLTRALLDLTKCICDFNDLKSEKKNIKPDAPEILKAESQFPTAIYWIIRSIVICQSQIISLTGTGFESIASNTEAWEITSLTDRVIQFHRHLKRQLNICYQSVEENRIKEVYQKIVNLSEVTHDSNTEVLKALVGSQEDALFNGHTKKPASTDLLGKKTVLLYISGLKLFPQELSALIKIYSRSFEFDANYDVLWLPVVDNPSHWDETKQKLFEATRDAMPWFSLSRPSLLDPAVAEYIKNVWHFEKTSILVTLNPKGKVTNSNALHMMFIWGSNAYPFTGSREEQLWAAETWRLELLVDSIEPSITKWIAEGKFICLYGGEDIEWIQKFTTTAKLVAQNANIPFEMLYMGASNVKERVQENNRIIAAENLSHTLADINQIWLFWSRLECIWHSRVQRGMSPETDRIIQEIFVMRSFDCSQRGWTIISRNDHMAKGMGDTMLQCLMEFDKWKSQVKKKDFVTALNENINQIGPPQNCNKIVWSSANIGIPKEMVCFECARLMQNFTTFSCCGDEESY